MDQDRSEEMVARGEALAARLVGLGTQEAVTEVERQGHFAQVLSEDVRLETAELLFARIRLYVDADGRVIRASAG